MTDASLERTGEPVVLTRAVLQDGFEQVIAHATPGLHVLSEAERAQSLAETLAARPAEAGAAKAGVWLFAYGSLIWNPVIHTAERRPARVQGWHRAFCLSSATYRGTPEQPGLVLGLDDGGTCTGAAYRIEAALVEAELALLWRREMLSTSYVPRWMALYPPLEDDGPQAKAATPFAHGIAFTINPAGNEYAGTLSEAETVARLATARGRLGSAADYLFRTRDGLRALGISDTLVERLAGSVATALSAEPERTRTGPDHAGRRPA